MLKRIHRFLDRGVKLFKTNSSEIPSSRFCTGYLRGNLILVGILVIADENLKSVSTTVLTRTTGCFTPCQHMQLHHDYVVDVPRKRA